MPESSKTKTIDIGDLTTAVTESVQRALAARKQAEFPGRIIIGIILEPHLQFEASQQKAKE